MTRGANTTLRMLFVVAAVVVAVLLLASAVQAAGEFAEPDEPVTVEYTVRYGDNLWSIAQRYTDPEDDVRGMVDTIRMMNRLDGSTIHSGQVLVIPAA